MIESFIVPVKKYLDIPCKILATVLLLTISLLQSTSAAAANELILDNEQPGTSFNGTWKVSGGVNPYGSKSRYADTNGASYTYNIDLATPGEYQVFAWWTEYPNRRTSVPYDIIHATGTSTVNVNQQQKGGTWQKLGGTWTFNNQATIRIRSLGNGTTSADAIKLVYVGNNAALPVVENNTVLPALPDDLSGSTPELDTGQPGTSFSGTWKVSGGVNSYGSKSLYADANGASYTYNIDLAAPGEYQVFAWWTEYPNRRTSVPYDIIHATGTSTVNVNQQQKGGTWQKLGGTRTFNNQATIRIRSLGNGTTSADAIKLVYVGNNAALPVVENNTALPVVENNTVLPALPDDLSGSTPELDTGQPGTSFSGTWKVSGGVNSYGSKSLYADANGASYTYSIDLAAPGEYQVFAWWTEYSNRRTSVPYDIIHATGTSTVNVNQQQKGGTWQKLGGTWTFNNQATIRIRSLGNGTTSADAIKLVYVGNNTAAQTGSAVLNWTAPVARADGAALALSEIAGYTVYYGTSTGSHPNRLNVDDGSATSATITDLLLGTYYIAVTTRDYEGRESSYSDEVVKIVN